MGNRGQERKSFFSRALAPFVVLWAWLAPAKNEKAGMANPDPPEESRGGLPSRPEELPHLSSLVSLSVIIFASLLYVAWGFFVFYTVGVKGPPPWNFGEVQDLPGASAYSTEMGGRISIRHGPVQPLPRPPEPQHVMKSQGFQSAVKPAAE